MPDRYFLKAIPFEGAFTRGTGQPTMVLTVLSAQLSRRESCKGAPQGG